MNLNQLDVSYVMEMDLGTQRQERASKDCGQSTIESCVRRQGSYHGLHLVPAWPGQGSAMHGNEIHHNHFSKASRHWDVPITVSKRSFIRFTFWMDQELALLEARWGDGTLTEQTSIDKRRFSSSDPRFYVE